ncbi:MAG: PIN domain-containing protein [Thermoleophilaceae bacterium]|nr:PIN domain-containing protein [Thermoleophilaceae bacterium]
MPWVVDASAVVALLRDETGADRVVELLEAEPAPLATAGFISTVNLAEVHQHLGPHLPDGFVGAQGLLFVADFTVEHALAVAEMYEATRAIGLSLADRACLALAKTLGVPAMTADRDWAQVAQVVGVDVELIR